MKKLSVIAMCTGLIVSANGTAMADVGASTYKQVCSSCHEVGISGAPILKDKQEWTIRIAQGMDTLYASTLNGKCKLLVQDSRPDLPDDAVKAAVDYMVSRSK
jgi:cytochrome c5